MDITMAKTLVINAGRELVASGLIARTWGNVSCRVDASTFAVTPSGRSYETLEPDDIVLCRVEDASYEGDIKPSSERRIHALVYQTYPEINFVIHTHQPMASILSASGRRSIPITGDPVFDNQIPIADYGLPGTKKLRKGIAKAFTLSRSQAVIMAHHGALCFGRSYEETFLVAKKLEESCAEYIQKNYQKAANEVVYREQKYYDYYIKLTTGKQPEQPAQAQLYSSSRTGDGFLLKGDTVKAYRYQDAMPPEAEIHKAVYQKRSDINYISRDMDSSLIAVSRAGVTLKPLLDDFAQIVGNSARCAGKKEARQIVKALGNRMGVLIPGEGALCCAAEESDLHAVELVMQKNAGTQVGTAILGKSKPIGLFDCKLMNFVYKKSYAKKAK